MWKRFVTHQEELDALMKQLEVIAVRRVAGQRLVHVYAESPPEGFEPASPDLEDVYFHALARASKQP